MAKRKEDYSYCLKHQERVTTQRCCCCMRPICEECTMETELGKFCGEECHLKRVTSNERIADLRSRDINDPYAGLLSWLKFIVTCLALVAAVYFIYPKLPDSVHKTIDPMFKKAPVTKPR
jgi:hypothetical protein